MQQLKSIQDIINTLEDMKVMTGRMGKYETDTTNLIIENLKNLRFFTEKDMYIAFLKGYKNLNGSNPLNCLDDYKKFMYEQYGINL